MGIKIVDSKARWPWGDAFLAQQREKLGPKAILAFSSGKDAVAMAIVMKRHFEDLIPFCCYYVPGLKIMDEALDYYEDKLFKRPIIRAPHPVLLEWLRQYRYQTPETAKLISRAELPDQWSFLNIVDDIAEREGLPERTPYALGARAGEFFTRLVMCSKTGGLQLQRRQWWPIWEMNRAEALKTIEDEGLALSREYELFHSSFCGLDYGFMSQLKAHEPDDWKTVKQWFPLIDAELLRFERYESGFGGVGVKATPSPG